jgi:thioredoxin 1
MEKILIRRFTWIVIGAATAIVMAGAGRAFAQNSAPGFAPLDQWRSAILAGDTASLKAFYSTDPAAQVQADGAKSDADSDCNFWLGLKARDMKMEIVRLKQGSDRVGIIFTAEVHTGLPNGQSMSVTDAQGWQKRGEQWRIVGIERTDAPHLKQPSDMKKNIYPDDADAHAEIKEAEQRAAAQHKRVLLVFGANWCYDCHVLDLAFQRPDLAPVLAAGYELVHVDLGPDEKKNADLVKQFDVPLNRGIPALAVAESDGKLVVSQKNGEFEDARSLMPQALLEFLNKWKP